jgi:hypothetical protein
MTGIDREAAQCNEREPEEDHEKAYVFFEKTIIPSWLERQRQ